MRRKRDKVDSLLVFAPIRANHEGTLKAQLEALPTGPDSPLAAVGGIHFARFVVIDHLLDKGGRPLDDTSYLLFGSEFDGDLDGHLDALVRMPQAAEIWGHCAGYRDDGNPATLVQYLLGYRVHPGHSIVAYPMETLDDVQTSLRLRERLTAFVITAQGLDAVALRQAWVDEFNEGG